jgi:hypothetical protein
VCRRTAELTTAGGTPQQTWCTVNKLCAMFRHQWVIIKELNVE